MCSFGYFSCTSKKSDSPVATLIGYGVSPSRRAKKCHSPLNVSGLVSPVLTLRLRNEHIGHGRVTFFACTKKVTKEMHPVDAALRASRELPCSSRVASTRHPCRDEAKCAIHGAFTRPPQVSPRRHQKGGNPKSRLWRRCPSYFRLTHGLSNCGA